MSWKGMRGCMGWTGNEHPLVVELIKQWNELGTSCGYIYSEDEVPMPEHLAKLNDAINSTREFLAKNPPKEITLVEQILTKTKSF